MQQLLMDIKYYPGEKESMQGMTWLELGLLFEMRMDVQMPRRWPPGCTNVESLHRKGAAIGQHVVAFKQGILEVMKTTINIDDHPQLSPVATTPGCTGWAAEQGSARARWWSSGRSPLSLTGAWAVEQYRVSKRSRSPCRPRAGQNTGALPA